MLYPSIYPSAVCLNTLIVAKVLIHTVVPRAIALINHVYVSSAKVHA